MKSSHAERPVGPAVDWRDWRALAGVAIWGILVAFLQVQPLLSLPAGSSFENHEHDAYMLRVLEFRDCIKSGYLFPQWCTNFRQGFGSPYFSYYQPGFFYAACVLPESIGLVQRVALTAWAFSLAGYAFTFLLVARRFCIACGTLAGTALVLSKYSASDLFIRGDFAEYAAMMTVPAILYWLDGWLTNGSRRQLAGFAAVSGLLVSLHACIALVTFGYLALILVGCVVLPLSRHRGLLGLLALALGAGVAAFYWLPVLGEWQYVAPEKAFSGFFDFSRHFVEPISLAVRQKDDYLRAEIGPVMLALLVLATVSICCNWKRLTQDQRQVVLVALGMGLYATFLMSSASAVLWKTLPLLYRLQFPWRLLSLISVSTAVISGCLFPWGNRWLLPAVAAWAACDLCVFSILDADRNLRPVLFHEPRIAADISKDYFAPDLADEWLPRGAKTHQNRLVVRQPVAAPGSEVNGYFQSQGLLGCRVHADQASYVELPHFYFPVGWTARLGGQQLAIERNQDGLMRIILPANTAGDLTVQFSMTPMRRLGVGVTVVSLLSTICIVVLPLRGFPQMMKHS